MILGIYNGLSKEDMSLSIKTSISVALCPRTRFIRQPAIPKIPWRLSLVLTLMFVAVVMSVCLILGFRTIRVSCEGLV